MTNYSMDTARTRFIFGHPDWEIEIQGSEHIGRDFDAWVRKIKADTLREFAGTLEHYIGTVLNAEAASNMAHYQADQLEKGEE